MRPDGRAFVRELEARGVVEGGRIVLYASRPGLWRGAPPEGALVRPGMPIGELEVLGVMHRMRAPMDAFGIVGGLPDGRRFARRAVDYRTPLMTLDPEGVSGAGAEALVTAAAAGAEGLVFRTPLGGRYYAKPSPDAEPFVKVGDTLVGGETVALIEVMKTFNRVQYTGERATVKAIVAKEGDDVENGDVLLDLEALA